MTEYATIDDLLKHSGSTITLDTETTGLSWCNDHIIGVGFHAPLTDERGYIPTLDKYQRQDVYRAINSFSPSTTMIFHNAKFDLHFLRADLVKHGWTILDTTVMIHLLDSRNKKSLDLAEQKFLGTSSKRSHVTAAPARTKIWNWPLETVADYCINDTVVTSQLASILFQRIQDNGFEKLFWKDMQYLSVLYGIEEYGVLLDQDFVRQSADLLEANLNDMVDELKDHVGADDSFNWRSPQQLSRAIYDGLGIPKPKNPFADADGVDRSRFADGGKYKSTCTSSFLLTEKVHHPLGSLISSIRECDKLRKSLLKYLELMDENGVLHTTFNLTGTRTGRLSSSKPNLQNIASETRGRFTQSVYTGDVARTDEFNARKSIVARPGKVYLAVDYKQMEMRMFGILSKDPFMLSALLAGKDVHLEIALKVWGDCGYDANRIHREWSKTISFGLIYGMTLGSLMYKLDMTKPQAAKITDQYWAEFPRIKPWMNEIIQYCKTFGFVRYWSGRVWREDDFKDMYRGCNALIQGGCADFLSIASLRVDKYAKDNDLHIINLVHDEIITEVPEDEILKYTRDICELMSAPDVFNVPFATDAKVGRSYGDLQKIPKELQDKDCTILMSFEELDKYNKDKKASEQIVEEEEDDDFVDDQEDVEDESEVCVR